VKTKNRQNKNTMPSFSQGKRKISMHRRSQKKLKPPQKLGASWKIYLEERITNVDGKLPLNSRKGSILDMSYKFTIGMIEQDKLATVGRTIQKRGVSPANVQRLIAKNPFQLCMNYLCYKGVRKVDPKLQHKWSRLLHYAYLHHVEAENLLGFLYQEGPYDLINGRYKKLLAKKSD